VKTIALKEGTYAELAALKAELKFKSFDDVVKFLLSSGRGRDIKPRLHNGPREV